jgi:type I restriction enzyme S subunit
MITQTLWLNNLPCASAVGRIKDHVTLVNGFPFDSRSFNGSTGTRLVRIRDLTVGGEPTYVDAEVPEDALIDSGDLVVGMDGDFRAILWRGGRAALNQRLCVLRAHPSVNQRFLAYVLAMPLKAINDVTYFTTVKHLSSYDLLNERIPVPPLAHQRIVAEYLDRETARIDALIAAKRRMVGLLQERVWLGFTARVLNSHPKTTKLRRALRSLIDGPFGSAFSSSDYSDEGAVVVRLGNIGFSHYRPADQARIPMALYEQFVHYRVMEGDLLIAGLGDDRNHAGRACVAPDLGPAMVKGKCFRGRVDDRRASAAFLALLLSSPLGSEAMNLSGRGSTRSMINLEIVKSTEIPLPSPDAQDAVVSETRASQARTSAATGLLEQQIALLTERRQALITAAVTGQLDIPEAA